MDKMIRTLIVDDELYSRDELKHLLQSFPSIQLSEKLNQVKLRS